MRQGGLPTNSKGHHFQMDGSAIPLWKESVFSTKSVGRYILSCSIVTMLPAATMSSSTSSSLPRRNRLSESENVVREGEESKHNAKASECVGDMTEKTLLLPKKRWKGWGKGEQTRAENKSSVESVCDSKPRATMLHKTMLVFLIKTH